MVIGEIQRQPLEMANGPARFPGEVPAARAVNGDLKLIQISFQAAI